MSVIPDVDATIRALEDLYHGPRAPAAQAGLRRAAYLLGRLGNPHRRFRAVHVAGSTGKGSTTTMVASILQAAGFRTGCFRSPHLHSYQERIAVDGRDIDLETWTRCFNRVWPVVEAMRSGSDPAYELGRPTLFEVLFAMMAVHFAEQDVAWAAVETGLGGRLDATNLLQPDVAVVTNVSLEHTQVLGDTVEAIAAEKAAIIKPGVHAVTAAESEEALEVIRRRAAEVGAPLLEVGRDVRVRVETRGTGGQRLELRQGEAQIVVHLPLAGEFQAWNAATAFAAARALIRRGVPLSPGAIRRGLESASLAGRFEVLTPDPLIVVDGAHNPAGARKLRATIQSLLPDRTIVFLVAVMGDKDVAGIARELGPLAARLVVTRVPGSERSAPVGRVVDAFTPYCREIIATEDVDAALRQALRLLDGGAALIVTGSLYLVGYAREAIEWKGNT